MYGVNQFNRTFKNGVEIEPSLKELIITELLSKGADSNTGLIPRNAVTTVSRLCRVSRSTVRRVWNNYTIYPSSQFINTPRGRTFGTHRTLNSEDEEFITFLISYQPSLYRREIVDKLYDFSNNVHPIVKPVSLSTISKTIRSRLPDGKYTRKKLQRTNVNRWTDRNIRYTRDYFNHIRTLNPYEILFYDESSFSTGNSHRYYGSSPSGQRAIEICKQSTGESYTLFLLCGLNGKVFAKVTDGSSTTDTFIAFILEALQAYGPDGEAVIQPNCTVVGDNCAIHRHRGEQLLHEIFDPMNVNILFLPVFSPTLNPVEFAFGFLKTILKSEPLSSMVQENVPAAVLEAVGLLTERMMYNFFKNVSLNYMGL